MGSTHYSLHTHVVFSTKNRTPWIDAAWRDRLHQYLGGCVRKIDGVAESVGGIDDHLHALLSLKTTHRISDVMREIKHATSLWAHQEMHLPEFAWQDGYGAFSVSPSQVAAVRRYIENQERHHSKRTFQEEYLELLKLSGVEYDEKYLW